MVYVTQVQPKTGLPTKMAPVLVVTLRRQRVGFRQAGGVYAETRLVPASAQLRIVDVVDFYPERQR